MDSGWAGDDDDLAVGGGEDDLGNGDLGGDGGQGEGGLGGGASWLAWDGDGGLEDDGGHWDSVGLLGLNSLGWAVGDDTRVGWDVWCADTLEELGSTVDLLVGGTEGGQALKELLGEVGLGAEAANVGVGLAVNWEPGLDALGKDSWARKAGVAAWGRALGGLGRSDGGVSWLSTLGGDWLSTLSGRWGLVGLLWARWLGVAWASSAGALGAEGLGGGQDDGGGGQGGLDGGEAGGDVGDGDWARGDGDIGDDGGQGNLGLSGGRGLLPSSGLWGGGGLWDGDGLSSGRGLLLSSGLWDGLSSGGGLLLSSGLWDGLSGGGGLLPSSGLWDGLSGGRGLLLSSGLWDGLSGGGGLLSSGLWDGGGLRSRSGLWCSRGGLDSWGSSGGGCNGAGGGGGGWAVEADAVDANAAAGLSSLRWLGVDDGDVLGATALGVLDGGTAALAVRLLLADRVVGEGVVELEVTVELDGHLQVGDGELVDRAGLDLGAAALVAVGGSRDALGLSGVSVSWFGENGLDLRRRSLGGERRACGHRRKTCSSIHRRSQSLRSGRKIRGSGLPR